MRITFFFHFGEDTGCGLSSPAALLKLIYALLQNLYQSKSRPTHPRERALPIKVGKSRDSDLPSPYGYGP